MANFESSRGNAGSGSATSKMSATLAGLTPVQKIAVGAAILTLLGGVFMFTRSGAAGNMSPLYTDLEARDAASVTEGLTSRGVAYELADGGRTVLVPQDQVYDMRVALSAEGLPRSNEGYALLDQQGITTSEFRQRVDYQRALEGELAMTLEAIDGVESATVHLALPEESVFVDEPSDPTASVLVASAPSAPIRGDQVAAMVHLVASSVKGMKPENVTIADASGVVLASGGEESGGALGATDGRADLTDQLERSIAAELKTMIGRVTGMENVAVSVRADLDLTQREAVSEIFDTPTEDDGLVVSERVSNETYTGTQASGETGVLGPDGAVVAPGEVAGENSYAKDDAERTYAINRTVESVIDEPGAIERLHVAVLVDEAIVSEEQAAAIEQLVSTASGVDPERGDQVVVTRLAFDTAADEAAEEAEAAQAAAVAAESRNSMIQTAAIALVALIALVLGFLSTRKARREVSTPIDLEALKSAPTPGAAAAVVDDDDGALEPVVIDVPPENPVHEASRQALEELSLLADKSPEDVAQILNSWLADEVSP
jgi:flagellar M-ring protein FliF